MKLFLACVWAFMCVALAPVPAHAQRVSEPWPHAASDIAPDPAVRFGALANGMRYALMRNQLPPEAVSIRFSVKFGSLNEADEERGLAHVIEHMAFNGSRHVPEGEMVRILERLGLTFGADTNASTGQTFTTYQLDLPRSPDGRLDEALLLLREIASELTFDPGAIDRERGVVLSEWRKGDTFQRRRNDQLLEFLVPGALAAARMPIGDAKVIETVSRERLVSLYQRYYRPERTSLVMVGDFDVDAVEQKIIARFGDWAGEGEPGGDPDLSYTLPQRPPAASAFFHKDGGDSISVYSLRPYTDAADTAAQRRLDNLLMFGIGALGRRLAPMANAQEPLFRSAGVTSSDILRTVEVSAGSVTLTPDNWLPGLQALEQEWRRALLHGFTRDEIDRQVEALRASLKNQAEREGTRTTGSLVAQLLSSVQNNTVFTTPSSGLRRFESWAGQVTPGLVLSEFRKHAGLKDPQFFIASTLERPGITEDVLAAWKASEAIPVAPPPNARRLSFAYTDFGKPGRVVKDTRLSDINVRLVKFANNVRLNIKHTDFVKNSVQVSVRVANGPLDFPAEPYGLNGLMSAFAAGGLEKHSVDELRTILQGRQVSARFGAGAAYFGASYATTPSDLELQLQLAAAYLVHPGYRPEAERRWRQSQVLSWPRLDQNAQTVWSVKGMRILMGGDRRFGADPDDGAAYRSFVELRHYLTPSLTEGAIEIAVVGDVSEEEAIRLVGRTFGALPVRAPEPTRVRSDTPVHFRDDRSPIILTHGGEASQALVQAFWPVSDVDPDADPQTARTLAILAGIMRLKVTDEVREALGVTYSPASAASLSPTYRGFGYVNASAEVKPEDATRVMAAFRKIAGELRGGAISDDEFERAIRPSLDALPQNAVSNGYWLSLIAEAQSRPDVTERAKLLALETAVRAVKKADVIALAQKYLTEAALQEAYVLPGAAQAPG